MIGPEIAAVEETRGLTLSGDVTFSFTRGTTGIILEAELAGSAEKRLHRDVPDAAIYAFGMRVKARSRYLC
jgi:hypothetical protein